MKLRLISSYDRLPPTGDSISGPTPLLRAILNWFRAKEQVALGSVEGLNNKAKVPTKKAYGFKSYEVIKIALFHTLGELPEPEATHRFCG